MSMKPNRGPRVLLMCACSLAASALATAQNAPPPAAPPPAPPTIIDVQNPSDWPRYLGPNGDGSSPETGWLKDWPAAGPPVRWWARVGEAYSAPVVADGRLVLFHRVGDQERVDCVDAMAGTPVWSHAYATQYEDRYGYNNGPRNSPTIDDGKVYTLGAEGKLTCLAMADGRLLWTRDLNAEHHVEQNFFGVGVAPVIEGDLILINLGAPDGAGVIALRKSDGETAWKASDHPASYSTPTVRTINGERMALFLTREGFLGIEPQTGRVRYEFPFRSKTNESVNAATPVVKDNLVFLSATYNTGAVLLRLKPEGLETVWRDRDAMQNHWATSVLRDGYLYGMDGRHENGSNFRCIEFMTGKVMWTADQGLGRATYIMAESRLIALGERGDLALIELSPERYIEKTRVKLLKYPCWTPPVMARGILYLRNENTLVSLDLRPGAIPPSAPLQPIMLSDGKRTRHESPDGP